ncbi:MAG: DUF6807 family protein [Pirellulales bacterium]
MRKQRTSLTRPSTRGRIFVATVATLLLAPIPMAQDGLRSDMNQDRLSIFDGQRLVLHYRTVPNPFKPYADEFFTPRGVNVVRDSPSDHKHHHGLMFAISVDGLNFWEEHNAPGKQIVRATSPVQTATSEGVERASFTQQLDWINPRDQKLYAKEKRTITVYRAADLPASLMSWETRLSVPEGKPSMTLGGHRYFGLGVRFLASMDDGGHFQNADGKTGVEATNLVRSAWCAYSAKADGKPVTLAMFDAPSNPRHPAKWYTMGDKPKEFAYLSATLNLKQEPMTISAGHPLKVRYGVALWDGAIDGAPIDALYRQWMAW